MTTRTRTYAPSVGAPAAAYSFRPQGACRALIYGSSGAKFSLDGVHWFTLPTTHDTETGPFLSVEVPDASRDLHHTETTGIVWAPSGALPAPLKATIAAWDTFLSYSGKVITANADDASFLAALDASYTTWGDGTTWDLANYDQVEVVAELVSVSGGSTTSWTVNMMNYGPADIALETRLLGGAAFSAAGVKGNLYGTTTAASGWAGLTVHSWMPARMKLSFAEGGTHTDYTANVGVRARRRPS